MRFNQATKGKGLALQTVTLIVLAVTGFTLTLCPGGRSFAVPQAQLPDGQWEGLIAFPSMPWVIEVNFGTKTATIYQTDATPIPLQELESRNGRISFAFSFDSKRLTFEGRFEGSMLIGQVRRDGLAVPASLRLLPEVPKPSSRQEAWHQDLDAAVNRFLVYDRSFSLHARSEFTRAVEEIRTLLPRMNDEQVIVALSRAVALSRNAHTRLYLLRMQTVLRRYPIRVWWFKDGLYVVKATPAYRQTLGCRVLSIGNHDTLSVRGSVRTLFSGNESWTDYVSVYYMTSPEILYGLGLIQDMERTPFTFGDCRARRFTTTLEPLPLRKTSKPTEAWWDLSPLHQGDSEQFVQSLGTRSADLPLYLQHPDDYYWFQYLPVQHALYFQYDKSLDMPTGENFKQFSTRLLEFMNAHDVAALIIDLRFNTGGDLTIASPSMQELHDRMRGKHVFLITGRATFSAGLYHAARWKQWGDATFVGEPVGDSLDFWAEGADLVLPNSHLTLRYSNGFHKYSSAEYPQFMPYVMQLRVNSLDPDVPIQLSARDYFAGRDPALDDILSGLTIRRERIQPH